MKRGIVVMWIFAAEAGLILRQKQTHTFYHSYAGITRFRSEGLISAQQND